MAVRQTSGDPVEQEGEAELELLPRGGDGGLSRNLFALSEGVRRTVCWHLAPEVGNYEDPFTMMELMHGKLPLLAYGDARLGRYRPAADSFRRLAAHLAGADSVARIGHDGPPEVCAFAINRPERGALTVVWKDGDLVSGEREAR